MPLHWTNTPNRYILLYATDKPCKVYTSIKKAAKDITIRGSVKMTAQHIRSIINCDDPDNRKSVCGYYPFEITAEQYEQLSNVDLTNYQLNIYYKIQKSIKKLAPRTGQLTEIIVEDIVPFNPKDRPIDYQTLIELHKLDSE